MMRSAAIFLLAGILLMTVPVRAETVTIATGEFPPWTTDTARHGGFINRVVSAAFARKGIDAKFSYMPWKRAEVETKVGRYDASSFWFASQALENDFVPSQPISHHQEVFFHLKSKPFPHWQTLSDLGGVKFGATLGYTYTAEFWELAKTGQLNVEVAARDLLNLKKVAVGRIDAFPMDEISGWMLLSNAKFFLPGIKELFATERRPLRTTPAYLLFPAHRPRTAYLAAKFNAGLLELKNDGTYDRFFQEMISGVY
ncbi:transporter substrate-binding domain-containing protein [Pseudoduganella sp. LjRoot289]|uniref:substrate-binding periplasmic protein n=1 Tax=Pseudoduganella sp. LjRoot289 TaxID=3342314 RepID=UPI003ED09A68